MAEQILIEFIGDASQLQPAIDVLEQMGQIDAKAAESFRKSNTELSKKADAFKKLSTEGTKSFDSVKKSAESTIPTLGKVEKNFVSMVNIAEKQVGGAVVKAFKNAASGAAIFEKELSGGVNDALKKAGVSAEQFEKALKDAGISTDEFGNMLVSAVSESKEFGDAVFQAEKGAKSFKSQLRTLKEELGQMETAGQEGTQQFLEMSAAAARLEDQIGDTAQRIRVLSSDTANIDAAVEGVQLLASGFQFASGAAQLLGAGEEDLQKALVKLNAVMAITQSLQQFQNFLRGQSILKLKAEAAYQGVLATSTRLTSGAFTGMGFAVESSSLAFKALRTAIITTGIGALVVGIGFLISKIVDYTSSADDATAAAEKQTVALKANKEMWDGLAQEIEETTQKNQAFKNSIDGGLDLLKRELELLKAKGASSKEIFDIEQKIRTKELEDLKELKLQTQISQDDQLKYRKLIADKENEIIVAKVEFEKEQNEKAVNAAKEAADKAREIADKNAKALFEIRQRSLQREKDLLKEKVDNDEGPFALRILLLQKYNETSLNLIELQRQEELRQRNLTGEEINNINDKFNIQQLTAGEEFFKTKRAIVKKYNDQEIEDLKLSMEAFKAAQQQQLEKTISGIDQIYAAIHNNNSTEKNDQFAGLKVQYDNGLIDLKEYEKGREEITSEYARREVSNEVSRLQAVLEMRKVAGEDITSLQASIFEGQDQLRQMDLNAHKKAEDEKTAKTKEAEQQRQQIVQAAFQILQQISDAYFEQQAVNRQADLDRALSILDTHKQAELNVKNLTEQQKDEINIRYAQKERQLKLKAFEEDKKAKRNQAIINGLLGVTNALATAPTIIAGIILAASVVTSTALSVAKINATAPGFKKGTKNAPRGYAWTGEEGPELIYLKGGEKIYTYNESKKIAADWAANSGTDKVMTFQDMRNFQLPAFVTMASNLPQHLDSEIISNSHANKITMPSIDYKVLAKELAKALPKSKEIHISMDEQGFANHIIEQGNKTEIRNQRFRMIE